MSEEMPNNSKGYEVSSQGNRVDEYGRVIPVETFPSYEKANPETQHRKIGSVLVDSGDEVPVVLDGEKNIVQADDGYIVEAEIKGEGNITPRVFEHDSHMATVKQEAVVTDLQTRPEQAKLSYWREQLSQAERDAADTEAVKARVEIEAWEKRLDERTGAVGELFYELRAVAPEYVDTMPAVEYMRMAKEYTDLLRQLDTAETTRTNERLRDRIKNIDGYINDPQQAWGFNGIGLGNRRTSFDEPLLASVYNRAARDGKFDGMPKSKLVEWHGGFKYDHNEAVLVDHPEVSAALNANERDNSGLQIAALYKKAFEVLAAYTDGQVDSAKKAVEDFKQGLKDKITGSSDQPAETEN